MVQIKRVGEMGKSDLGWLQSDFHFSFADYYNPQNMEFGNLRVLNDDIIHPNTGFGTHPHKDMEIISYVINGDLTHQDSMGNKRVVSRGHFQYMSAGTGVTHSEHNFGSEILRLLQIWIKPSEKNLTPNYGDLQPEWDLRLNNWYTAVGPKNSGAPIEIYQDATISVLYLKKEQESSYTVNEGRQAYLVQIEGSSSVNDADLHKQDALEVQDGELKFSPKEDSHYLLIDLKR